MKLIELLKENEEFTCWDTDYDMEFYMEKLDENDDYNKAMMAFARCVEVKDISPRGLTLKVTELIESNLEREEFRDLFIDTDIDSVMYDWDNIMAGYASESWYSKFAELVKSK